jgi:hypothetical protein
MAATSFVPFLDVRAAIDVVRREVERLANGLACDVEALVARSRDDIAADLRDLRREVRLRADAAVKDLEARGAEVVGAFERELAKAAEGILKRLSAATQSEIAALSRRVAALEQRSGSGGSPSRRRSRGNQIAEGA